MERAADSVTSDKKSKTGENLPKPEREKLSAGEHRAAERRGKRECYVTLSSSNSAKTWPGSPRYDHNTHFLMEQIKCRSSGRPADA